jgi:hypothetical protein
MERAGFTALQAAIGMRKGCCDGRQSIASVGCAVGGDGVGAVGGDEAGLNY